MSELFLTLAMFWKIVKYLLDEIYLCVFWQPSWRRLTCTSIRSINSLRNALVLRTGKCKCLKCSWLLLCFERFSFGCLMKSTYMFSTTLSTYTMLLLIACPYCFHQRVVCLIAFVFPSTLAYSFGPPPLQLSLLFSLFPPTDLLPPPLISYLFNPLFAFILCMWACDCL